MPLVSTEEDLNKEYLSKLIALQSVQLDAIYAFGAYSDQEEKYDIKISNSQENIMKNSKVLKKKNKEEIQSP